MKVAFHTLGCKVNSYETQAVSEQFEACGFELAKYDEYADVYVVNTCSVTGEAARKSRQILNRAKKINPDAVTVACGCYAQEAKDELEGAADIIVGNNEKSNITELVLKKLEEKDRAAKILVDDLSQCRRYEEQQITNAGSHVRAYVKIQDGCDRFCSYCIIPYLRGRSRSRSKEEIIKEIKNLVGSGYKEIVITGIDISDYKTEKDYVLKDLIKDIDKIEGIERIRLGSLEEGIADEDFIKTLSECEHICPQFHLSLQSGSDAVLKRMNRKYDTEGFRKCVQTFRKYFKDPAITTDMIVGFPQETEDEFKETLEFMEEMGFSAAHIFKYSRRKNTVADKMEGQLTDRVKTERSERLIKKGQELNSKYKEKLIGQIRKVLIEEKITIDGEEYYAGYTPEYIRLKIKSDKNEINNIIDVEIGAESFI